MLIDNLMFDPGPSTYYDPAFMIVLEDHMTILRNSPNTKEVGVEPYMADIYEGDFYGLLSAFGVQPWLHWLTLRMNNFTASSESPVTLTSIIIPNADDVDKIRQTYMTTSTIS